MSASNAWMTTSVPSMLAPPPYLPTKIFIGAITMIAWDPALKPTQMLLPPNFVGAQIEYGRSISEWVYAHPACDDGQAALEASTASNP